MIFATEVVHTTGINWESFTTTILAILVAFGGGLKWVFARLDKNRAKTESFVTEKVDEVANILDVKLTGIGKKLDSTSIKLDDTRDRVLRIEGKIDRS
jgi:hypothetical protein